MISRRASWPTCSRRRCCAACPPPSPRWACSWTPRYPSCWPRPPRYGLDYAQLHGHETPTYCRAVRAQGLRVIKAFSVDEYFDFSTLAAFSAECDLFLFDTKGAHRGGNGRAFDWSLLADYQGPTPFLLSGGLGPANAAALLHFQHPQLAGYDFNSLLETAPGLKDVEATGQLLTRLHAQPIHNL